MTGVVASLLLATAAAPPAVFVRTIDTGGDKAVAVVADSRFEDHEPIAVTERGLTRAMMNTGLFTEDDIREFAPVFAQELPAMTAKQQIRVIAWSQDGSRRTYLWIHHKQLQVAYYRGAVEIDRTHATLPVEKEGTVPAPVHTPGPSLSPVSSPVSSPVPSPAVSATLARGKGTPAPAASPKATPGQTLLASRLTEDEVRGKLTDLESRRGKGQISGDDYRRQRKEILNRL